MTLMQRALHLSTDLSQGSYEHTQSLGAEAKAQTMELKATLK